MLANIANKGFPPTKLQSIMSEPFFHILHKYIRSFHKNKTWFFNLQLNNFTNNFVLLLCPWRVLKNLNLKLGFELSTTYLVSKNYANLRGSQPNGGLGWKSKAENTRILRTCPEPNINLIILHWALDTAKNYLVKKQRKN